MQSRPVWARRGARWRRPAARTRTRWGGAWPEYEPAVDPYREFGEEISAGEGLRTERCDFLDRFE